MENEEETMTKESPKRGWGRRQVLLGGAATALAVGLGVGAGAQGLPKPGGRLRLGLSHANTADDNEPAAWGTSADANIRLWGAVYNQLTQTGPDRQLASELAEGNEPSKDALTRAFKLCKGETVINLKPLD